jgi:tetratricopeptide (TPR) repeat protein
MAVTLNAAEEAQLLQTIEMFEAITQSQPQDVQSLEILKEAYSKLGRDKELIATSKRIAEAYVQMGQISSAILEYEGILQRFPDDPDTLVALGALESKAASLGPQELSAPAESDQDSAPSAPGTFRATALPVDFDDGRAAMHKIFVEGKIISQAEFDACWITPDLSAPVTKVCEPFVQLLAEKGYVPLDKALRVISDKTRLAFLPLERYDIDVELARSFPKETLYRWCVLPFDRMSKSILVATTNPFNKQASLELEGHTKLRLLWYLAPPGDIAKLLRKIIR